MTPLLMGDLSPTPIPLPTGGPISKAGLVSLLTVFSFVKVPSNVAPGKGPA